tara:strand:- start:1618 stop:1857 length:240 start_codon:yes stop_codon:yes gene_type:complete
MPQEGALSHLEAAEVWLERFQVLLGEGYKELPEELIAEALMEIHLGVVEDPQRARNLFVELTGLWGIPPDQAEDIFLAP